MNINSFLNENLLSVIVVLLILVVVLAAISTVSLMQVMKLKKRYELFTGGDRRADYTIETQFEEYHKSARVMEERYTKLSEMIRDMDRNMEKCVQKVGIVRYNPFNEVGGDLSYAVALLDSNNNGVVLNGIHSRTGSFTYAKPVELGVSEYTLSAEEIKALEKALSGGYTPENRQDVLDELEKTVPKTYTVMAEKKKPAKRRTARRPRPVEMPKDISSVIAEALSSFEH